MSFVLDLKTVKDGSNLTDCVGYISNYRKMLKKDGKNYYIAGTFTNKEDSLSFKVWDAPIIQAMTDVDYTGSVVIFSGSVSSYMNSLDIKITAIQQANEAEYPKSYFLKSANVKALFAEFNSFISTELSKDAVVVLNNIFKGENIFGRFTEEFAGSKMHDAQIGGLLHHTMKMCRIAKVVYDNEPRMKNLQFYKDMLLLSVILHDIGKVYEMNLGVYTENSFVTHRILGVEILVRYKDLIVKAFDENFFYEIISVIQGHHGAEWGDAPTTVLAQIVHYIDMLDSQTTGIFDKIERNDVISRAGGIAVNVNGSYLTV